MAALLQIAPTPAGAASLVIDAAGIVAESDSGDDLATLRGLFQGAHAPHDFASLGPLQPTLSGLGMKRMRILQADVYSDLDGDGVFRPSPPGVWDNLTGSIDWALQHGLSLHFPVAYFMPLSFAAYGPAETWPQTILERYRSYARQLVQYAAARSFDGGASSIIFEVSNELDIDEGAPLSYQEWLAWVAQCSWGCSYADNPVVLGYPPLGPWGRVLWWMDPATFRVAFPDIWGADGYPFLDDVRRVTRAVAPLQKVYADAVASVLADTNFMATYPGKTIEIAGPALAGHSFRSAEDPTTHAKLSTLEDRFIDHMFDANTASGQFNVSKLDYFSFHYYGDFRNGPDGPTTALGYMTARMREKLTAAGHPEVKLFVSEWGPSADLSSDINYSHKGAAWAAAFLAEAVANKVALGSYLQYTDAVGEAATGTINQASLLHKLDGAYYPKPPANVFRMFAMMSGARRPVSGLSASNPDLGAFAASDANSAGVVVVNYNPSFTDEAGTAQSFTTELRALPFAATTVTVERYLIDARTSNLQAFLTLPSHPSPELQRVEQFTAQVDSAGSLSLPTRTLGLGVSFWRITR
ncbi:hypothetical protein ACTZWT_20605 [Rhodopseudomonas sp. NSM]|uniref:hypothetical protein n=1 Tax=Rhodopseudomonas sp. NSM TaxID=3457630 RepID=UPI004037110D